MRRQEPVMMVSEPGWAPERSDPRMPVSRKPLPGRQEEQQMPMPRIPLPARQAEQRMLVPRKPLPGEPRMSVSRKPLPERQAEALMPVSLKPLPELPAEEPSPKKQEFKEGGFGWVVVVAIFFLNAHTWGFNTSYAVFLAFYIRYNTFNTSALAYAFIGGLSLSTAFLVSPLATFLAGWDKFGTRLTIFTGVILEVISFVASSFATKLWHIILAQGVTFGISMGLAFVASSPVPAQWFHKNRSLANGLATAGSGLGGLIYSIGTNAMIEQIGLAWTFRTLALLAFVVNSIAAFYIRDRNHAVGTVHIAFNWRLLQRPSFILLQIWMSLSIIGYIILIFSMVAYSQSIGMTTMQSSLSGALFSLGQTFGRPLVGLSCDFMGALNIANIATLWCGILCFLLWAFAARTFAGVVIFALLGGSVAGAMWATIAPLCAEVVGLPLVPSALSMTWLFLVIPATFAEVIGLSLRTPGIWGYVDVEIFTGCMYVGAFVFGWILRAWKVRELELARLELEQKELTARNGPSPAELDDHADGRSAMKEKVPYLRGLWTIQRV